MFFIACFVLYSAAIFIYGLLSLIEYYYLKKDRAFYKELEKKHGKEII